MASIENRARKLRFYVALGFVAAALGLASASPVYAQAIT